MSHDDKHSDTLIQRIVTCLAAGRCYACGWPLGSCKPFDCAMRWKDDSQQLAEREGWLVRQREMSELLVEVMSAPSHEAVIHPGSVLPAIGAVRESDTPRTDANVLSEHPDKAWVDGDGVKRDRVLADFARQIERELAHMAGLLAGQIRYNEANPIAPSAIESPSWIPWSTRPPERMKVLVTPGFAEEISIDYYCKEYDSMLMRVEDGHQPTHWMPLPVTPADGKGAA